MTAGLVRDLDHWPYVDVALDSSFDLVLYIHGLPCLRWVMSLAMNGEAGVIGDLAGGQ